MSESTLFANSGEAMTTEQALNLLQLGLDHPGKNLQQSVTQSRLQAGDADPCSKGLLQTPLEQELHKLEQHYGLPPREPVTLAECLWELSRRMSGLECQPPTFPDELWED